MSHMTNLTQKINIIKLMLFMLHTHHKHANKSANPFQDQDRNGLHQQQQKVAATATHNQLQFPHPWKRTLHTLNQVMRASLSNILELKWLCTTIADWNCIACFIPWCMKQLITTVVPLRTRKPSSRNTLTPVARHPLPMENPLDDSDDYTGDSGFQEAAQWAQHMHYPTLFEGT